MTIRKNNKQQSTVFLMMLLLAFFIIELSACHTKQTPRIILISVPNDTATLINESLIYKLNKMATKADFNYQKLNDIDENIDDTLSIKKLMPIFDPIGGQYVYYQFISTFKGMVCCDGEGLQDFHNILIIKTDNKNKILDAYHYTLEWAEQPLQFDLYKSDTINLTLKNGLEINSLKLTRKEYWDVKDRILNVDGGLKFK